MAAAGLWTTASDLARFAMGIQQSLGSSSKQLLLQPMARQMVTRQKEDSGLGVFVEGKGSTSRFSHRGRDEGFDSALLAYVEGGKGVVILMNANDESRFVPRIFRRIAELYHWPDFPVLPHRAQAAAVIEPGGLAKYEGRYQLNPDTVIVFAARNGRLYTQSNGMDDEEFIPDSQARFLSAERDAEARFDSAADGAIVALRLKNNGTEMVAPRVPR
jgi:CubicO group peptidase (beta-lactamase class C family)